MHAPRLRLLCIRKHVCFAFQKISFVHTALYLSINKLVESKGNGSREDELSEIYVKPANSFLAKLQTVHPIWLWFSWFRGGADEG